MENSVDGKRASDILVGAKAGGFTVTERQLKRWHGLLPRPTQLWEVGKLGSDVIYPLGTTDQLIALCAVRRKFRSLKKVGWALWWLGFPVNTKYWKPPLIARAISYDKVLPRFIAAIQSSIDEEKSERQVGFISRLKSMRIRNVLFRQLRKRLGLDKFDNFLFLLGEILRGDFYGLSSGAPSDDKDLIRDKMTIDRALGLFRAGNQDQIKRKLKLYNDVEEVLIMLSGRLGDGHMTEVLRNCSEERIADARNEIRAILSLAVLVDRSGPESEKWGLGLKALSSFNSYFEITTHQMMLVFLIALKEDSAFKANIDRFIASLRKEVMSKSSSEQIDLLRRRDPALADLLQPR